MPSHRPSAPTKVAILIETSTAYGRGLLRGIARFARSEANWTLYLKPSGKDGSLPNLKNWNVDGLLVRVHNRRMADRVLDAGLPTVDLGYAIPDLFPWRISNHQQRVGELAAEHLLACGLRHFAFCGWGPAHPAAHVWENARLKSYQTTIAARGFVVNSYVSPPRRGIRSAEAVRTHLAAWLGSLPKPVGLMAANDERALEILDAAQTAGIEIPTELALVGVDNDEVLCEVTSPTLSSVALDLEQIGWEGAALLHRLLRGRRLPRRPILVPPLGVVSRASTDVIAVDDDTVVAAVRFIHANIHRPLNVADVLNEVNVSRKSLELRFQAALGRTPYDEILRRRMSQVKDLLLNTDWPLTRIAAQSGFSHVENLYNVFRREMKQTPGEFRSRQSRTTRGESLPP